MARRSYTRDARGRFASTPGGGARKAVKLPAPARRTAGSKPQKRRGLLIQRSAAAASKRKLKGLDPADQSLSGSLKRRAQKGAVTRAANRLKSAQQSGRRRIRTAAQPGVVRPGKALRGGRKALPAENATKPAIRGKGRIRVARPTPAGIMRKSDLAKVKADARKGIGTPASRAGARAVARSAREALLLRKQAIAVAKRKGATGFGGGPRMNTGSIGSREFNWNRNEQLATARERLAMWQKGERRLRGHWSADGNTTQKAAFGAQRATRRAAELVETRDRRGDLPTTRSMAERPRERRAERVSRNEVQGRLASSEAGKRLLPQIQKNRDAAQKRIAEGKKPTAAQLQKERQLVGEYNKLIRKLEVAKAAKEYTSNPYGYKPRRMSPGLRP